MHARVGVLDREDSAVAFEGCLGWIMQHSYRAAVAKNCTGISSTGGEHGEEVWPANSAMQSLSPIVSHLL